MNIFVKILSKLGFVEKVLFNSYLALTEKQKNEIELYKKYEQLYKISEDKFAIGDVVVNFKGDAKQNQKIVTILSIPTICENQVISLLDALDKTETAYNEAMAELFKAKSRCEAFERAIKQATENELAMWSSMACFACSGPCDNCEDYNLWRFDEARFAKGGDGGE